MIIQIKIKIMLQNDIKFQSKTKNKNKKQEFNLKVQNIKQILSEPKLTHFKKNS